MNLILLKDQHFTSPTQARLNGRYVQHLREVLKVSEGDWLSVGQENALVGKGQVKQLTEDFIDLDNIQLDQPAPPTLPLNLVLALPRPRMLQRSLQTIATMGVKHLSLIQSSRVEKSYWQTPLLKDEAIVEQFTLGLEQAKATQMPSITLHKRFRPFIEDELPSILENKKAFIAHPGPYPSAQAQSEECVLVIGPEGGFIQKEVDAFCNAGCSPIQLGERILRVETAIPVLLAKLF